MGKFPEENDRWRKSSSVNDFYGRENELCMALYRQRTDAGNETVIIEIEMSFGLGKKEQKAFFGSSFDGSRSIFQAILSG